MINGDGIIDIASANIRQENIFYFGDQDFQFSNLFVFDASCSRSYSMAVGVIDNDGDQDLAIANVAGPNIVFINNNKGMETNSAEQTKFMLAMIFFSKI